MKKEQHVKLTRSIRRYVREEKARIRRSVSDAKAQAQRIAELYGRVGRSAGK